MYLIQISKFVGKENHTNPIQNIGNTNHDISCKLLITLAKTAEGAKGMHIFAPPISFRPNVHCKNGGVELVLI